ncbi:MAG TPA: SDR family oxidoreductase [Marmoricola sp.]|nr:SDR family oxidoreductase [Marmoricola sp.]
MRHLVTVSGSGIGAAIADLLQHRGDELVLLARSQRRAADLQERYPGADCLVADLNHPEQCAGLAIPDRLDSVIHAAGVVDLGPIASAQLDVVQEQVQVNLVSPVLLTQACLPALRAARGTVVFINSTAGLTANPGWGAYAASKFGLRAVADTLRAEEQPNGVRVTTVFPGRTATPMQEQVHAMEGRTYDSSAWMQPETVAARVIDAIDLPPDAVMAEVVLRPT